MFATVTWPGLWVHVDNLQLGIRPQSASRDDVAHLLTVGEIHGVHMNLNNFFGCWTCFKKFDGVTEWFN
jgi:hypothetical protein